MAKGYFKCGCVREKHWTAAHKKVRCHSHNVRTLKRKALQIKINCYGCGFIENIEFCKEQR